jgi:hypothetical protein
MTLPGFGAELALDNPASRHTFRGSTTSDGLRAVIPQQLLFPPGTPIYTCSPPCTWGPPQVQVCCAVICFQLGVRVCLPICYRRLAPLCPR